MKNIKNCVKRFKRDNKIFVPNWKTIAKVADKNNWLLMPYSSAEKLIQEHNLADFVNKHRAFTYQYFGEIIILYRDDLQEYSKLQAVCHEVGHIYLKHMLTMHRDDNSQLEAEADCFADLLLNWHKKALAVASVMIIILLSLILSINTSLNVTKTTTNLITITETTTDVTTLSETTTTLITTNESTQELYYISRSGSKYHNADCYHIDVDKCTSLTLEEVTNLGYEPCKTCRPDRN